MESGKLQKLVIKCFKNEDFTGELPEHQYTALLNPETYSQSFSIEYFNDQVPGTSKSAPKYTKSSPSDLDLEFLFDRTGALIHYGDDPSTKNSDENNKDQGNGIKDDIENFKKAVFSYNGDIHKPNYLQILWGTIDFKCVLSQLSFEYKLFKSDGTPLRAIAKAKFISFTEDKKRVAEEDKNSPDLTHYRKVKDGDNLPLMTYRIYGDSKYYLEVAKVNKLVNFRKLEVGTELFFPPLIKAKAL